MRKAWCKTAQLVLELLYDGCILMQCFHPDGWKNNGKHSYLWHMERGETVRIVQDSIATGLIAKGYVVEVTRNHSLTPCYSYPFARSHDGVWKITYRAALEHEDLAVLASRNRERDAVYKAFIALENHEENLLHLAYPSGATCQLADVLKTGKILASHILDGQAGNLQQLQDIETIAPL